jgi:hypothetical protein
VDAVRSLVIDEFDAAEVAQLRDFSERIVTRIETSSWRQELT